MGKGDEMFCNMNIMAAQHEPATIPSFVMVLHARNRSKNFPTFRRLQSLKIWLYCFQFVTAQPLCDCVTQREAGDGSRAFPVGPPLRSGSARTVPTASLKNSAKQLLHFKPLQGMVYR